MEEGQLVHSAKAEEVIVPEQRVRKIFDKKKLQDLADSFLRIGQCQPGVCATLNGKVTLVAGERRLRACQLSGLDFLFLLQEDASEDLLLDIEIEENLNRVNLDWREEIFAIEQRHHLLEKRKKARGVMEHSYKATAEDIGRSVGQTYEDIDLAAYAREIPEVAEAQTKQEARKIVKRLKGEVVRKKFLEQAIDKSKEEQGASGASAAGEPSPESTTISVGGINISSDVLLNYDKRVIHGTLEKELESFKSQTAQIVFFDPPWGVNIDEVRKKGGGTSDFEDTPEQFSKELPQWLDQIFQSMASDSHLYMFFGIVRYAEVYNALKQVGFITNGLPLMWYKQGAHVTRNPEIWPGRSYEPIAYARKGSKKLERPGAPDVIVTPAPTPAMKQSHPTAKHPDIYMELLKRSARPGDVVLDPMAGSCMSAVACEVFIHSHRLDWLMIEKDQEFRDLGLTNIVKGYHGVVNKEPILDDSKIDHASDEEVRRATSAT
ncbi:hypothetical protein LCGC14_2056890, partial [marine sediment metagenome]